MLIKHAEKMGKQRAHQQREDQAGGEGSTLYFRSNNNLFRRFLDEAPDQELSYDCEFC